jgi:HTH-type transcriptional regulator / antitoxin HigA
MQFDPWVVCWGKIPRIPLGMTSKSGSVISNPSTKAQDKLHERSFLNASLPVRIRLNHARKVRHPYYKDKRYACQKNRQEPDHAAEVDCRAAPEDGLLRGQTERDYQKALKEIEKLWDAKPNTPKGDRLEVLVTLVEAYEQKHHRIDPPDPIEAIKFRMEQLELKPSDLADILGGRNRVSEVLNKKRKLTVEMMRFCANASLSPLNHYLHER